MRAVRAAGPFCNIMYCKPVRICPGCSGSGKQLPPSCKLPKNLGKISWWSRAPMLLPATSMLLPATPMLLRLPPLPPFKTLTEPCPPKSRGPGQFGVEVPGPRR